MRLFANNFSRLSRLEASTLVSHRLSTHKSYAMCDRVDILWWLIVCCMERVVLASIVSEFARGSLLGSYLSGV